ncbi:MAG: transcriptional repressor [Candidatus Adiutrix sp.]|jgi:Fur family ferric uptake transcriptional regulator|nr:transcriptional repressor [Candidatus Adiutrix sp.]
MLAHVARRLHRRLGCYLAGLSPGEAALAPPQARETESLATLLASLGYQDPVEPLLMLEAFHAATEHLTPAVFSRLLKDGGHSVSEIRAAGVLDLFSSLGFAERRFAEDGQVWYEPSRPGRHHDHLVCSGCGRTVEFHRPDVDLLIEKIAGDEDFRHLHHQLVIYGLCPECRRRRHDGLPLADTTAGETVEVTGFTLADDLNQRLSDLGLRRGSRLKILGERSGAIIALLDGCRLALGPEISAGVMVRAVGHHSGHKPSAHHRRQRQH